MTTTSQKAQRGALAGAVGLLATFWIAAIGTFLATLILVFSPLWGLKKVDAYTAASSAQATTEALAEVPPDAI